MKSSNHSHFEEREDVTILGVRVLSPWAQISENLLSALLACPEPHLIVTANPEILVRTTKDERYRSIVQGADVVVADGCGIVLAGLVSGRRIRRITGVQLVEELLRLAYEKELPVHFALFGSGRTTLRDVQTSFPQVQVSNPHEAAIVIANFGAPKQEYWLDEHKDEFPNARIMIGVGSALDYLTGRVRRAPIVMRALGLEWLYRLLRQPKRWKRIWHAVVVFPFSILTNK